LHLWCARCIYTWPPAKPLNPKHFVQRVCRPGDAVHLVHVICFLTTSDEVSTHTRVVHNVAHHACRLKAHSVLPEQCSAPMLNVLFHDNMSVVSRRCMRFNWWQGIKLPSAI
jgi:hypothetical protein